MKVFKPIYYSSLALLIILFLIFTAVDFCGVNAKGNIDTNEALSHVRKILNEAPTRDIYLDTDNHEKAVNYIANTALKNDLELQELSTYTVTDNDKINNTGTVNGSVFSVIETTLKSKDINNWYSEVGISDKYVATAEVNLTNIAVYIPAKDEIGKSVSELTSDTVMYITHYDSKYYSPSANNLAIVGAMIESIRELSDISGNKNSFLFVFADGGEYNALGAYAFREKFIGFNNVYSRVKAAYALDSLGSSGALALLNSTENASKLVSKWAMVNKKAFASSVLDVASKKYDRVFDYNIFKDIPALNFANIGSAETENMVTDNLDNLNSKLLSQTGALIVRTANSLANYDLKKLPSSGSVNFSFLGGVINYSNIASYVLASILLVLAGVVVVFNAKKKSFSMFDALKGALVQLITLAVVFVVNLAIYYAVGGLLAAMGFVNIHALSTYMRSNIGLIIAFSFISVAISIASYSLLKKIFRTRAADTVRGNILIWTLLSIILGYAVPKIAYIFMFVALLELIVVLVMIFTKDRFKQRFKMDIERILLFIVPLILTIPVTFGASLTLYTILGLNMYPVIMLFTVSTHGFITPYFNYLVPALDSLAKKLPMRTVRIQRVVTEKIEHKAKKGKFEERTIKKVFKEKRPREYKNSFGISVIALIGVIMLFIFSMVGQSYGKNYTSVQADNYSSKTCIVYYKSLSGSFWLIEDLDMYRYISYDLDGYEWDPVLRVYKKAVSNVSKGSRSSDLTRGEELAKLQNITTTTDGNSKTFTVSYTNIQSNSKFHYDLELTNAKNISKVTIKTKDNSGIVVTQEIDVNTSKSTLVINNLKGESTITVTGKNSVYNGTVSINAQVSSYQNSNLETGDFYGFEEWEDIKKVAEDKNIFVYVVLRIQSSQSI
ncbi:MAG TPA: M28 family peptidase [Clostridia bacterium]